MPRINLQVNCLHELAWLNCFFNTRLHAMELDIKSASKAFNVSRPTIYKKFKSGELSRLSNGRIDSSEMVRVFGEPSSRKPVIVKEDDVKAYHLHDNVNKEKETLLLEKIRFLESALHEARTREDWFKGKVDELTGSMKLLQSSHQKEEPKKGLLSRFFG